MLAVSTVPFNHNSYKISELLHGFRFTVIFIAVISLVGCGGANRLEPEGMTVSFEVKDHDSKYTDAIEIGKIKGTIDTESLREALKASMIEALLFNTESEAKYRLDVVVSKLDYEQNNNHIKTDAEVEYTLKLNSVGLVVDDEMVVQKITSKGQGYSSTGKSLGTEAGAMVLISVLALPARCLKCLGAGGMELPTSKAIRQGYERALKNNIEIYLEKLIEEK